MAVEKSSRVTAESKVPDEMAAQLREEGALALPAPDPTGAHLAIDDSAPVLEAEAKFESTEDMLQPAKPRRNRGVIVGGAVIVAVGVAAVAIMAMTKPDDAPPEDTVAPEVAREVAAADKRIAVGDLSGPGSALEHLNRARTLRADDPEVTRRLAILADKFEELGDSASKAGNLAEAATHYQAALLALPDRGSVATKMRAIEDRIRLEQSAPPDAG